MLVRCAWHRRNFGWRLFMGVSQWRPLWPVQWSDGMCSICFARFRARRAPALLGRLHASLARCER
jgi:hypothetical protein